MKILLIRFSSLGDVVLATAAANFIKAALPEAEVTFLTKPAYAALLQGHPAVQQVWALEGGDGAMLSRVRAERFDAVVDLHGKIRSRFFAAFSGAKSACIKNYAWNRRLRVWLKLRGLAQPPDAAQRGVQAAAGLLGLPAAPSQPSLKVSGQAGAWADAFLKGEGLEDGEKLIAVCPGASYATKRWSEGAFAQALGLMAESGRRFLFVGDAKDAEAAGRIRGYLRKGAERVIVAAGKSDFAQLAALLAKSELLLCNDSGPMHVAGAVGTPVVALFGPTIEAFGFFPRGPRDQIFQRELGCRPCSVHGTDICPIGTHECMEKTAPFDVAQAAGALLKS